jgi:hypothetical protein
MLKPLLLGTCLAVALTGCAITTPHSRTEKIVNTALTGACLAAQLAPAARRSSCLTDTGPRLPVSSGQCATYGATGATR